jgi:DNA-binding PadR family transcriptional regulator
MAKWLQSGLRRDICIAVAGLDEPTGRRVKREVESKYEATVRPKTYIGAMNALVDAGFLVETPDGIHERYALTDAGRERLDEQFEWLAERVE